VSSNKGIKVDLPKASTVTQEEKGIVISINKTGDVFFNNAPIAVESLTQKMTQELSQNPEIQTVIYADRMVPYHYVIQVIDEVRLSGARNFLLEAKKFIKDANQ